MNENTEPEVTQKMESGPAASAVSDMEETTDMPQDPELKAAYDAIYSANAVEVDANARAANTAQRPVKISCHACGQKLDLSTLESFSHINCPVCNADLIVPKWFDIYLLEESGGVGGMATVYRALDLALDREVAIKVLRSDLASQIEKSELFLHEARTAATINHYAVIPIYTCGIFENQPYIVMQYMGGGSLENLLKNTLEPLAVSKVLYWIRDIASGLENARTHGVVHHDIKPANIMLDSEGKAKIGDFGIAQIATRSAPEGKTPDAARFWLSPHYASPEKIRTGNEDFRGDIYSLGATFYHLLTGSTPFNNSDMDELLRVRLTADPVPPHLIRKDIPAQISMMVMLMMARNPEERPDYTQLMTILDEYINSTTQSLPSPLLKSEFQQEKARKNAGIPRKKAANSSPRPKNRNQAVEEKQHPFLSAAFMLLLGGITIAVILAAAGAFLFVRTSSLDFLFDKMPRKLQEWKRNHQQATAPEKIKNAVLVEKLMYGDSGAALDYYPDALEEADTAKCIQSAFLLCSAAYLHNRPDARQFCARIYNDLKETLTDVECCVYEGNLLFLRAFAGELVPEDIDKARVYTAPDDFYAKAGLVSLLIRLYREPEMQKKDLWNLVSFFHNNLEPLPDKNNLFMDVAFRDRVQLWQKVATAEPVEKADVEPLFKARIDWNERMKDESAENYDEPAPESSGTEKSGTSGADSAENSFIYKPSGMLTLSNICKVNNRFPDRPRPAGLYKLEEQKEKYLDSISDSSMQKTENHRIMQILYSKDFLLDASASILKPCTFDSIQLGRRTAGTRDCHIQQGCSIVSDGRRQRILNGVG